MFATNRLCVHPVFQRPKSKPFEIKCFLKSSIDIDERKFAKPDLYEQFGQDNKFNDFTEVLNKRAGLQNVRKSSPRATPFKPSATKTGSKIHSTTNEKLPPKHTPEELKKLQQNYQLKEFEQLKLEISEEQAEKTMAQLTSEFFDMDYCFVGKSRIGYKIKICNRIKITMYEEDEKTGKIKNEVVIGKFTDRLQRVISEDYNVS